MLSPWCYGYNLASMTLFSHRIERQGKKSISSVTLRKKKLFINSRLSEIVLSNVLRGLIFIRECELELVFWECRSGQDKCVMITFHIVLNMCNTCIYISFFTTKERRYEQVQVWRSAIA